MKPDKFVVRTTLGYVKSLFLGKDTFTSDKDAALRLKDADFARSVASELSYLHAYVEEI